ncbi:MAG: hypothetical protein HUU38_00465 [Anaerolineales bacterium]|nr:hypothetical protein [Anaerolineales bacterium]
MVPPLNIANTLLNIEQKLIAYQTLHENEIGELWKILNDCKRMIVATCDENERMDASVEKNEEPSPF